MLNRILIGQQLVDKNLSNLPITRYFKAAGHNHFRPRGGIERYV